MVASSHIDDPRWQGLVFQDDVHHACPMRCPCPLFRVSWAQPKGDSCRCHCPLPEGPGINLQPMFPPARGFHKAETGDVELRQPHSGGPPGSGDCNSKSQRGEHTLTILKVRLPLVGCVGVVAMESRPLCNLINVVAQALSLTPRPHKAACIVDGVLPRPCGHHLFLLGQLPMETTQRVLPNAAPTPVCQGLELGQDKAACQIVLGDAELICPGQVWKALGVAVTPQRAGARFAITQVPRNLPGPRLGAAVKAAAALNPASAG